MSVLEEIVGHHKPSRSPSDAAPLRLFKEVFPSVLTGLNRALYSPTFPKMLKHAVVKPLIKKPALDTTTLSNFRPTTAISFLRRWFWVIFWKSTGFREFLSCLLTLVSVILVPLDLMAAFDTADHEILMSPLECWVGTRGVSSGVVEILPGRPTFCVNAGDSMSSCAPLPCGVLQDSVVGPLLFSLHLLPLGSILRRHGLFCHCYADVCQIYWPLKKNNAPSTGTLFKRFML